MYQWSMSAPLPLQESLTAEQKRAAAASYAGRRMGVGGAAGGNSDRQWRRLRRVSS